MKTNLRNLAPLFFALYLFISPLVAAPAGSVLKSQPSGIVDEDNKVVGSGPPLNVVAPGAGTTDSATLTAYQQAMLWLGTFLNQMTVLEKDMMTISQALATDTVAVKELRESLASLEKTRDLLKKTGATKNIGFYDDLIKQKLDDLRAIQTEQDNLIDGMNKRWQELKDNLQQKMDDSKDFPEFRQALVNLSRNFEQKQTLSSLRLQLSAGHSREFRQIADATQGNDALRMPVLLMRIADYMEQGEGRNALYAARLGMQLYPDNPAFAAFNQSQEVSYLKMMSAKADEDGARIHKAWNDYAGQVSDNWVKQFFFGGVRHTLDLATGKEFDLEQIQKSAMLRSAMEHNGLEVIARLRKEGASFDEIRTMSADDIVAKLKLKNPLSAQSAEMFHAAVKSAFYNDDMKRLLIQSKEQFDVDMGKAHYGAEEFDTGLLEYAADGISAKNVILFFGPGAMVSQGTRGAMARLATKFGMEEKAAMSALQADIAADLTAQELLTRPIMDAAGKYMSASKVGSKVLGVMEKAADLRYYEVSKGLAAGERLSTVAGKALAGAGIGIGEALGQMIVFEAGGKVGNWAGGDLGKFIVEAGVMFAGSPLEAVHSWQAREAATFTKTAAEMAERRAKWSQMNDYLEKNVRVPIQKNVNQLAAGESPSQAAVRELENAIAQAEQLRAQAPAANAADGPVVQAAIDEADALAAAGKAAQKGDAELAQAAQNIADENAAAGAAAAAELEKGAQAAEGAARRAGANPLSAAEDRPSAAVGEGPLEESSFATAEQLSSRFNLKEKAAPVPPEPEPPVPTGGTPQECDKLAQEAMRKRDFKQAAAHYRAGFEMEQQAAKANPNFAEDYGKGYWVNKIDNAEQAARYAERNAERAVRNQALARESDKAMEAFTAEERAAIKQVRYEETEAIAGTAGGPRRVKVMERLPDGTEVERVIGIWKPKGGGRVSSMEEDGQQIAEVFYSWMAKRLGLRVPYAEKWSLVKASGAVEEGVLIRYIPHVMNLQKLTPGAILSLKDQIAKFRPLQILLGNYDIHFGNFMIDKAGRVWSIDAGMAELGTSLASVDRAVAVVETVYNKSLKFKETGDHIVDYARLWRDTYRIHGDDKVRNVIRELDQLMTPQEMGKAAVDARQIPVEQVFEELDKVMPNHEFIDNVKETFKVRQENMKDLVNERWSGVGDAVPGPAAPGARSQLHEPQLPRSVSRPSEPQRGNLLRLPPRISNVQPVELRRAA